MELLLQMLWEITRAFWMECKKMAEALINLINKNVNVEDLTAQESDVFDNATFVGSGSESVRTGRGTTRGAPIFSLGINGYVNLPEGKYTGGEVRQDIPVLGEQRVSPTSKNISLPTKDVYMGGNIVVNSIPNLVPENIKKGEYVGGVGPGTWEGYLNDDPNTFFLYGTFAPSQTITPIRYSASGKAGSVEFNKKSFDFVVYSSVTANDPKQIYSVFELPIDVTTKSKLVIEFEIYRSSASSSYQLTAYGYRNKVAVFGNDSDYPKGERVFQKQLAIESSSGLKKYTGEIDLTPYSRDAYLYLYATVREPGDFVAVKKVQFV